MQTWKASRQRHRCATKNCTASSHDAGELRRKYHLVFHWQQSAEERLPQPTAARAPFTVMSSLCSVQECIWPLLGLKFYIGLEGHQWKYRRCCHCDVVTISHDSPLPPPAELTGFLHQDPYFPSYFWPRITTWCHIGWHIWPSLV